VAIPSALTRQWELQLGLNSPMGVATSLSLKKQPLPLKNRAYNLKSKPRHLHLLHLRVASQTSGL